MDRGFNARQQGGQREVGDSGHHGMPAREARGVNDTPIRNQIRTSPIKSMFQESAQDQAARNSDEYGNGGVALSCEQEIADDREGHQREHCNSAQSRKIP